VIPQAVFLLETRREPSGLGNREGREARNSHASMYNIFGLDANRPSAGELPKFVAQVKVNDLLRISDSLSQAGVARTVEICALARSDRNCVRSRGRLATVPE
jgi:hypothetical protein